MGNLEKFTRDDTLVNAIYAWWKKMGESEERRGYLGGSSIGHECERYLWYSFRNCCKPEFDGRMYRLFNTGHMEEPRFVRELRGIGMEIHDVDEHGNQIGIIEHGGHFRGHLDGMGLGVPGAEKTWHVLEFKTHSAKSFAKLVADGVKKSKPQHYAQMQVYMGSTKQTRALYLARNKDTDELYSERIRFDKDEYEKLMEKARRIIFDNTPAPRVAVRSDDFRCRMCDARVVCWGGDVALPVPELSCRQCISAVPIMDGTWSCSLLTHPCRDVCSNYAPLPGIVQANVYSAADDGSLYGYEHETGKQFKVGQRGWTGKELMITPWAAVLSETVADVKEIFEGSIVQRPLIDQFPPECSELVWEGEPDKIHNEARLACPVINSDPVAEENTEGTYAARYGEDILLVVYKADNYAAVWRGKK